MKLSVSLPDEDVEFLDAVVSERGYPSRSAVVQRALRLLRTIQLADDYADAWSEWSNSEDAALWDSTTSDAVERG